MVLHFHPARQRPKAAAALAFALGILLQGLWQWTEPLTALVVWAALVVSIRDFFAPTTYELQPDALVVDGLLKLKKVYPWRRFRSYIKDRNGIFLSPYRVKRATESQRGVFLPLTTQQRDSFEGFCQELGLEKRVR